ncbi:hypothetical protein [Halomonas chromatireducens]|uniref:ATP-dependent DNA helicase RecG n=1 Tax=Halomonas chromatireducens TaxID=507626 RepID=A0A109ULG1_9GAMM|nr:hypothetical protein [Halomonas chromatireducens]AMD00472.1 ATP-dependent DNA helicase RecG [Halomonas chromatireducens]
MVVPDERRPDVVARIRHACAEGRQAYWVCTLIEESEALQCQAAEATHAELGDGAARLEPSVWRLDSRLEVIGETGSLPDPEALQAELTACAA